MFCIQRICCRYIVHTLFIHCSYVLHTFFMRSSYVLHTFFICCIYSNFSFLCVKVWCVTTFQHFINFSYALHHISECDRAFRCSQDVKLQISTNLSIPYNFCKSTLCYIIDLLIKAILMMLAMSIINYSTSPLGDFSLQLRSLMKTKNCQSQTN